METDTKHWFIAVVPNNTERVSAETLQRKYEVFVPSQQYVSIWKDGRRKLRDRILLPGKILIRCTEAERLFTMNYPFVRRYMVDIASSLNEYGRKKVAVIPDDEVERLRFILSQSEVPVLFDNENLLPGEKVRILRGSLQGLEAEVIDWASTYKSSAGTPTPNSKIQVRISHLGNAKLYLPPDDLERM